MSDVNSEIDKAVTGRYPIIYLNSPEEQRMVAMIQYYAQQHTTAMPVITWSCTSGFDNHFTSEVITDPLQALKLVLAADAPGFFVMKDLLDYVDQPGVERLLRDAYEKLGRQQGRHIVITAVDRSVPVALRNQVYRIEVGMPGYKEMLQYLQAFKNGEAAAKLPEDVLKNIALSLMGLTLNDATHIMHQILHSDTLSADLLAGLINENKKRLVAGGGLSSLEFVPVDFDISQIGGLDRLKEWIEKRRRFFTHKAQLSGMPVPKGILVMGISGCGKSMAAKVVAKTWRVPLFRLDMNLLFSQMQSTPEAAFHRAMQAVESAAPAVLWIDEIENGFGLLGGDDFNQSHVFSAFLTWMQEKSPLVFVAATANRIESLPAELIRKGRFDQVFFCDLPDQKERAEILQIHIRANKQNPDDFDIDYLTSKTEGWNGAEIELAVKGARIDAYSRNRNFTVKDIAQQMEMIVPLSETMKEQINRIKDWAWDRATPASTGKGREMSFTEEGMDMELPPNGE